MESDAAASEALAELLSLAAAAASHDRSGHGLDVAPCSSLLLRVGGWVAEARGAPSLSNAGKREAGLMRVLGQSSRDQPGTAMPLYI